MFALCYALAIWQRRNTAVHSRLMVCTGLTVLAPFGIMMATDRGSFLTFWTLFGTSNLDIRSLRLNFELNVECYSVELGAHMEGLVQARLNTARPVTLADVNARSLPVKLRDGVARLFAPFL